MTDNGQQISVPIDAVLEEAKAQRNEALDQILLLKAYLKELEERNRELEGKINGSGIVGSMAARED